MNWFYISFVGNDKFLGACLVRAIDEKRAHVEAIDQGCNPGGEALVVFVGPEHGEPPKDIQNVLFSTKEELQEKFSSWLGENGARTETIKERRERDGELDAVRVCEDCNSSTPPSHN